MEKDGERLRMTKIKWRVLTDNDVMSIEIVTQGRFFLLKSVMDGWIRADLIRSAEWVVLKSGPRTPDH